MGQTIAGLVARDSALMLATQVDAGDSLEEGIRACDVIIDFSAAGAVEEICRLAMRHDRALVIGTTGHTPAQKDSIQKAAGSVPIVFASNFSIGVNVLFWLTGRAAKLLGADFKAKIVETHHIHKKDAPSGTAKTLAQIIKTETGADVPTESIREGEVVGDHVVTFSGTGECLELAHHAESRETFASGALTAAKWVVPQRPGLYTMQDVLGL